ncbi:MAG: hypothetical protein ACKVP5_04575 [Aestuariivirga sp.]
MHDLSTRASRGRRKDSAFTAAVLAAALLVFDQPAISATSVSESPAPEIASGPRTVISMDAVAAGQEAIELSASLEEGGGLIQLPIRWTVTKASGEPVFDRNEPLSAQRLSPGEYIAEARYGAVRATSPVTIPEAGAVRINFILNAGGLRILPRLKGLATTLPSEARIIPLDGPRKGAVLATYQNPGEVLRVPAGAYRIESRFVDGNAMAATDVRVKPGLLSAVEFDHIAGIARLQLANISSAPAAWRVKDSDGSNVAAFEGIEATLALRPGSYVASVNIAGRFFTEQFVIAAGETSDISLGN